MSYTKVKIVNCKRASIRRTPWIPLRDKDIVGIKDASINDENTVNVGSIIEIDQDNICYDWTDRKFYKVKNPDGWIYEGCIQIGDSGG